MQTAQPWLSRSLGHGLFHPCEVWYGLACCDKENRTVLPWWSVQNLPLFGESIMSNELHGAGQRVFDRLASVGYQKLTKHERVLLCVWSLQGEVDNGGFDQFYFNSSGDYASDTPQALKAIGAVRTAVIVREANALLGPTGPSADRNTRIGQLDSLPESAQKAFSVLENRFYKKEDDLDALLESYVRKNPRALRLK
jgi:hypothetical protein